jgi:hypothetical protein
MWFAMNQFGMNVGGLFLKSNFGAWALGKIG